MRSGERIKAVLPLIIDQKGFEDRAYRDFKLNIPRLLKNVQRRNFKQLFYSTNHSKYK